MARASDGTDVPVSPLPASSSNMGSPNGPLPDLRGTGYDGGENQRHLLTVTALRTKMRLGSKIASRRLLRQL